MMMTWEIKSLEWSRTRTRLYHEAISPFQPVAPRPLHLLRGKLIELETQHPYQPDVGQRTVAVSSLSVTVSETVSETDWIVDCGVVYYSVYYS